MKKQVADGVLGAVTVAVGVSLMLYGGHALAFYGGLWAALIGGYVGAGVFEADDPPPP